MQSLLSVGGVPIFSGVGFVDEMYFIQYGFLYTYKFVMLVSMSLMFWKLLNATGSYRFFWATLLVLSMVISLFDGKRVVLLSFFIVACLIYIKSPHFKSFKNVIFYAVPAIIIYVLIGQIRSGEISPAFDEAFVGAFYTAGVEYRDYALTFTNVRPGEIENYDWFMSSFAALVNSSLANIVGFDKAYYSSVDSARAFMHYYDIELGIRTGLISELWFAYGWMGIFPMLFLGLLCRYLCGRLDRQNKINNNLFLGIIYSFSLMAIMGQSSILFGLLLTLLYIYVAHFILCFIFPNLKIRL